MNDQELFLFACEDSDVFEVKQIVEKGVDIHYDDEYGFRIACFKGHLDIVKYLTMLYKDTHHNMIDIHARDDYGFKKACEFGHLDVVLYLTSIHEHSCYTKINLNNVRDESYLWACFRGNFNTIKYMATLCKKNVYVEVEQQSCTVRTNIKFSYADLHICDPISSDIFQNGFNFQCIANDCKIAKYLIKLSMDKHYKVMTHKQIIYYDLKPHMYKYISNLGIFKITNNFI